MYRVTLLAAAIAASTIGYCATAGAASPDRQKPDLAAAAKSGAAKSGSKAGEQVQAAKAAPAERGKTGERTKRGAAAGSAKGAEKVSRDAAKAQAAVSGTKYDEIVRRYATAYGVPVALAKAVIKVESNYRPEARGRAGEVGLMQIKPATARMMGYSGSTQGLFHPETNIRFGMKYLGLAHQLGGGTTCGTILKYNAGHGARRMNPVSSAYCSKVKRHLRED